MAFLSDSLFVILIIRQNKNAHYVEMILIGGVRPSVRSFVHATPMVHILVVFPLRLSVDILDFYSFPLAL